MISFLSNFNGQIGRSDSHSDKKISFVVFLTHSNIRNMRDNFLVYFNSLKINVGLKKLIVIVQQDGRVDHGRESNGWDANASKIARICAAGENLNFRLQTPEMI